ncbi:MAG: glutamate-5-semialdehyde dehydrogenase [SAR86 cluster bacterium]|nr:glutamate-5-semialdehyde dehydrogenase [SAR86 cluster bacterium]
MKDSKDISSYMELLGSEAKSASEVLSNLSSEKKNSALTRIAKILEKDKEAILKANHLDLSKAKSNAVEEALIDRLELTRLRINSMIGGLLTVADLPDPIGSLTELKPTPSGIKISQMRVPLGVVGIIYESRPNVTADAAALCLKSGNACILRGGSEAFKTNTAIANSLKKGLLEEGLPEASIQLVETTDREAVKVLLSMNKWVDIIIPRGGKGLVKLISDEAKVPVIKHLDGICHVYLDEECDVEKAISIAVNAKTYRYGICGAMETLLVNKVIAGKILPVIAKAFEEKEIELRGCERTLEFLNISKAVEEDWVTEYLAPILSIKIVDDLNSAIDHINKFGSAHTDSIVTENIGKARVFMRNVDSSSVMHNVPTCWADGFEYGLGAEVGISTDKFHARGPVGLEGLTSLKYLVEGNAELRGN